MLIVSNPLPIFTGLDGAPLDGAKLYFGTVNQNPETNPITVYWDSALTQPAAQPILTLGGVPVRNGTPTNIYTSSTYSLTVRNKTGNLVYFFADSANTTPYVYSQGGSGAVVRTLQDKLREIVSVKDFGAVGDGVTNDRAAIAAAVVAARGKRLFFPAGQYLVNTDSGSITLEEVSLVGEMVLDGATATLDQGAVLRFTGTTNSPFLIRRGVTIDGLGFYYPNQVDSATPVAYPPTLDFDFSNGAVQFVYIQNNVVYNAYRFVRMNDAGGAVGHVWITDNTIYGINTCIEITHNAEVIKILGNSFTFGHWLAATEAGCRGYTRANGTVLSAPHTDGFVFADNMAYGYCNGLNFPTAGTLCQLIDVTSNLFDQVRYPFVASGNGNVSGIQFAGNSFVAFNNQNTSLQGNAVRITTTGAIVAEVLTFSGNTFSTCTEDAVYTSGSPTRALTFSANSFTSWAAYKAAGNYAALNINGAQTTFNATGNQMLSQNIPYSSGVLGSCSVANLLGNIFGNCQAAINGTYNNCVSVGNQSYSTGGAVSDTINASNLYSIGNYWDKASGGTTRPAFLVRKAASQATVGSTPLTQVFGTTSFDKGTNFSGGTTFTAPKAGRYEFDFSIMHDNTGTVGDRFSFVLTASTGQTLALSYKMIADYNSVSSSGILELPAGGTVTLVVTRVGGTGVLTTFNDANYNYLCGRLVE